MVRAEMNRIFTLPYKMTGPTNINDGTRLEEAELVCQMMCVHAGTATDLAEAALTVVNKPADPLPLDGIHKFFVGHALFMLPMTVFAASITKMYKLYGGWWERPSLIRSDD